MYEKKEFFVAVKRAVEWKFIAFIMIYDIFLPF